MLPFHRLHRLSRCPAERTALESWGRAHYSFHDEPRKRDRSWLSPRGTFGVFSLFAEPALTACCSFRDSTWPTLFVSVEHTVQSLAGQANTSLTRQYKDPVDR